MKQFLFLALLFFALSRNGAGQVRGQADTTRPDSAKRLKEVVIRGSRPPVQQSIAGTVVNVQSSIMSKGSSVLDVLERSLSAKDRRGHTRARAIAALCVGGMVLARSMENRALADELRDACMGVALMLGGWKSAA